MPTAYVVGFAHLSHLVRSSRYCITDSIKGEIIVPPYRGEPQQIVKGLHEPIIDAETFDKVQDILSGKRKNELLTQTYFSASL